MFQLFANNLLPVFLAAGAGYLISARGKIDPKPVAHIAFCVFAPCLIYRIVVDNQITGSAMARTAGFTAASLLILSGIALLVARRMHWPRPLTAAVVLTVLLPNAGNFGLSANLFAFGSAGLAEASLYFITAAILSYTAGVFVASLGRASMRDALLGLLRVPPIWAVLFAFVMVRFEAALPLPVDRVVTLLADACIPTLLIVLGMQLHGATWRGRFAPLAWTVGLRLVGGAALALVLVGVFGLEGPARQAGVLQSAMPSAVITIILATQYDVEPGFVTSAVFVSTILSPLTLTPLLAYLGA